MQVADVRGGFGDDLPVQFQHQAQDAVGGGMGRPHVEDHFLPVHVRQFLGRGCFRNARRRIGILDFLGRHNYFAIMISSGAFSVSAPIPPL